ncbi:inositol monophosphatase [Streptomyces sp. HU2014]|uniref:inositol monophosphatase family protein n=1 Tax=Streptomyces sp. HU2014 TaxID=2939414 RepID=UPI00200D2018|nr:inositol monophosphatase [Streptomyces sp. HU2014]UQI43259.1 inositol monophosphatase [Streptomyces sp. HU2014]
MTANTTPSNTTPSQTAPTKTATTAPTRPAPDLARLLPAAVDAARAAGTLLADRRPAEPSPATDLASLAAAFRSYDEPAAALLHDRLGTLRPQAGLLTDEFGGGIPDEGEWWLCDATDGAVQYLQGLPHWCVSVTLLRDGVPVLAVLHAPLQGMTYTATLGGGARLGSRPVRPSRRALSAAVVATSHPPFADRRPEAARRTGGSLGAALGHVLAVRNLGPTSLQVAHVASGHLDAFWSYGPDATNLLPGALIAREAGATVTDAAGGPWNARSEGFLAASPTLHQEFVTSVTNSPAAG